MSDGSGTSKNRNGNLRIPGPFDDALRAALKVKPESIPPAPKRPPVKPSRAKRRAK